MKKIIVLMMLIFSTIFLTSCRQSEDDPTKPLEINNLFYDSGLTQAYLIYSDFYHGPGIFSAYSPSDDTPGSEFSGSSALWSYGALMTMLAAAAKINPNYEFFKTKTYESIVGLEEYRMKRFNLHYSATPGGGEPYYDDNAWVVLGLYEMAKVYNDDVVMAQSRELLDYVLSGEAEEGGIYWKETVTSRNTCSSAPGVIAALLHYMENPNEEQDLLDTAIRIYNWTRNTLRDPKDYVYWDNAVYNWSLGVEEINKTKWTYNSGTMIWAGALLYKITGNQVYLQDANDTATGALSYFYQYAGNDKSFYPKSPWFNLYLLRGFIELAKIYEDNSRDYFVNSFIISLKYAITYATTSRGFIHPNWGSGINEAKDKYVSLLDTTATVEILFLLADWELSHEK